MTFAEALRRAVAAVIAADLNLQDTRTAITSLIPKEHHVIHHQP
jgi:hypothetical protein